MRQERAHGTSWTRPPGPDGGPLRRAAPGGSADGLAMIRRDHLAARRSAPPGGHRDRASSPGSPLTDQRGPRRRLPRRSTRRGPAQTERTDSGRPRARRPIRVFLCRRRRGKSPSATRAPARRWGSSTCSVTGPAFTPRPSHQRAFGRSRPGACAPSPTVTRSSRRRSPRSVRCAPLTRSRSWGC